MREGYEHGQVWGVFGGESKKPRVQEKRRWVNVMGMRPRQAGAREEAGDYGACPTRRQAPVRGAAGGS